MKTQKGFTLLELVVVFLILGILSVFVVPSFLKMMNRARETESRVHLSAISRAQHQYFLENEEFASSDNFDSLNIGLSQQANYFNYQILGGGFQSSSVTAVASPISNNSPLRAVLAYNAKLITAEGSFTIETLFCQAQRSPRNGGQREAEGIGGFNIPLSCPNEFSQVF